METQLRSVEKRHLEPRVRGTAPNYTSLSSPLPVTLLTPRPCLSAGGDSRAERWQWIKPSLWFSPNLQNTRMGCHGPREWERALIPGPVALGLGRWHEDLSPFHFPLGGSQAKSPSWKRGGQSQLPPCTPETPSERAALPVVSAEAPTPRLVGLMWCRCRLPLQSPWPAWGGAGAQGRHSARGVPKERTGEYRKGQWMLDKQSNRCLLNSIKEN